MDRQIGKYIKWINRYVNIFLCFAENWYMDGS